MKYFSFRFKVLAVTAVSFAFLCVAPATAGEKADKSRLVNSDDFAYIRAKQKILDGKFEEALPDLLKALKGDPESPSILHELAMTYLRLGKVEDAEPYAAKAVQISQDNNMEYRTTYGGILASLRKYDEARVQYGKVMEIEPGNPKVPLLQSVMESEAGKPEDGLKIISKFIDANPESFMAFFYRAKIYLESENIEKAKADLDKSLSLRPNFLEAGTALGMLYEKLGDEAGAIAAYAKIQGSGRFKKRLGQLYLNKNEFEKALAEFEDYEKVEPDDYTARLKTGLLLFELKRYEPALVKFRAILKEQKDATNVHFYMGLIYEEMKQDAKAMAEFKLVPQDATYFSQAMLRAGFMMKEQGKIADGLAFSKKLVKKNPDVIEFYDLHASFFEAKKDYKGALAVIGEGRKRFPQDDKLLYFEGALYDKMGNRTKAVENMKAIIAQNPNNPHALNFLGYTYAEMGENLDQAIEYISKALTLRPNDGYILDSLGWAYFRKGDLEKARENLNKAAEALKEEPIVLEHLGDLALAEKNVDKATALYKQALAITTKKKDASTSKKLESKIVSAGKEKRVPTGEETSAN